MAFRTYENWIEEGHSPLRIGYGAVTGLLAAGSLVSYLKERHHPGSIWYLVATLAFIVAYLAFEVYRWRTKYRRRNRIPVSVPHREDLNAIAAKLADVVATNKPGDTGNQAENLMIRGHFSDAHQQFLEWNKQVLKRGILSPFLRIYLDNDLRRARVAFPVLRATSLAPQMASVIEQRFFTGVKWDYTFSFNWSLSESGDLLAPEFGIVIDAAEARKVGITVDECQTAIELAFRTQHKWFEDAHKEVDDALKEVSTGLETTLRLIASMDPITGECPACNQSLLAQVNFKPI